MENGKSWRRSLRKPSSRARQASLLKVFLTRPKRSLNRKASKSKRPQKVSTVSVGNSPCPRAVVLWHVPIGYMGKESSMSPISEGILLLFKI